MAPGACQAVMLRLTHHPHDDEDVLTDLLNEQLTATLTGEP